MSRHLAKNNMSTLAKVVRQHRGPPWSIMVHRDQPTNQLLTSRVGDLQIIISKLPIGMVCGTVLPEFGVQWRDVSRAVRNARLPMTSASVAKVISRHAAKTLPNEEIIEIVSKLKLKLVAIQRRTWHVIKLSEQISDEPVNVLVRVLPARVEKALRSAKASGSMRPEVQSVKMGDLIYISIQMLSATREGTVLYVAYPPGEPVALVSSLHSRCLRPCILGLGYKKFEETGLNGRDVYSLLRISNNGFTELPEHLTALPEYVAKPCIVRGGIDFTGRTAAEQYAAQALGADPPHLTKLSVTMQNNFFNPDILKKKMKITIQLKSDDVARSLQSWATKGAIHPTSELFRIFHQMKTNKIYINSDEE